MLGNWGGCLLSTPWPKKLVFACKAQRVRHFCRCPLTWPLLLPLFVPHNGTLLTERKCSGGLGVSHVVILVIMLFATRPSSLQHLSAAAAYHPGETN